MLTCVTAFAHFLVTAVLSLTRLYTYKATLLDLGLVDQAIWNTAKYGAPITTVSVPYAPYNWLGFHFSPIVLALVAVYRWIPRPELLIILQTLLISASTILIFRTCVALLKKPGQAYSWGVLFLLNPFIWNGAVWDFHEKSFAVPAFSLAYYALVFKRRALFVIALAALVL